MYARMHMGDKGSLHMHKQLVVHRPIQALKLVKHELCGSNQLNLKLISLIGACPCAHAHYSLYTPKVKVRQCSDNEVKGLSALDFGLRFVVR